MTYRILDAQLHASASTDSYRGTPSFGSFRSREDTMVADAHEVLTQTLREMDANGVKKGVLLGPDNRETRRWVDAYPDRFVATFFPDHGLREHSAAVEMFDRDCEDGLWTGLGEISLPYVGRPLNDVSLFRYYEVCERRGLPVSFHTGFMGANPAVRIELSDPLLLQDVTMRFPALRVVILHMGWPFFGHASYMTYAFEHVYLEIGAVNWIVGKTALKRMLLETVEREGDDRILFGSDQMVWPQLITQAVESITKADYLAEETKHRILWQNAARLYRLDDS